MTKRTIKLVDGRSMVINDNEWLSVINRKEFDKNQTEIVRVNRHVNGLLTRVYVMRSVLGPDGQMKVAAEQNHVLVGEDVSAVVAKAISDCGLTHILKVA